MPCQQRQTSLGPHRPCRYRYKSNSLRSSLFLNTHPSPASHPDRTGNELSRRPILIPTSAFEAAQQPCLTLFPVTRLTILIRFKPSCFGDSPSPTVSMMTVTKFFSRTIPMMRPIGLGLGLGFRAVWQAAAVATMMKLSTSSTTTAVSVSLRSIRDAIVQNYQPRVPLVLAASLVVSREMVHPPTVKPTEATTSPSLPTRLVQGPQHTTSISKAANLAAIPSVHPTHRLPDRSWITPALRAQTRPSQARNPNLPKPSMRTSLTALLLPRTSLRVLRQYARVECRKASPSRIETQVRERMAITRRMANITVAHHVPTVAS